MYKILVTTTQADCASNSTHTLVIGFDSREAAETAVKRINSQDLSKARWCQYALLLF